MFGNDKCTALKLKCEFTVKIYDEQIELFKGSSM